MADKGTPFSYQATTALPVAEVNQRFAMALASLGSGYFDCHTLALTGPNSIVVTRKFTPVWVIVVAVIGAFCFLAGLLALLYREQEVVMIEMRPSGDGTAVAITGVSSAQAIFQINAVLSSL